MPYLKKNRSHFQEKPSDFTTASEKADGRSRSSAWSATGGNSALAGFTLIELLVTIAIIGLLSSVVLTSTIAVRENARDALRQTDLNQIQLALEQYFAECETYPTSGTAVVATLGNGECAAGDPATQLDTFMSQVPLDPNDGNYGYAGTQNSYCLSASLESDNTPDNDADCAAEGNESPNNGGVTYSLESI